MEQQNVETKNNVNRKTVTSNLMWRFLERFGAYAVSFVISVVLARILDPSTYGIVAIMTVIISFLDIFVTAGFANSLIYDKKATEIDFNTLLIFNILVSLLLYLILFFTAPFIANYYNKAALKWLIRFAGVSLVISGVKNLQYAFVAKRLEFKKFFFATIGGTVVSGVIGIILALRGFGPWALVAQSVCNHLIDTIILWFIIKWKPKVQFSFPLLFKHIRFGYKILISKIVYNISNSIRQLVIGKKYTESDLAFYNRGKTYPNIFGQNIISSINSVMFPVLTKNENDKQRFNEILKKSFNVDMFVILPLMVGFFCVAEPFIQILLGAKWIPCVPYIRAFCFVVIFNTVESVFCYAPMALGKSGLTMFLDIIECVISILLLIIVIPFGTMAIAYSMVISSFINCTIYIIAVKKLTGFKFWDCLFSSSKSLISVILMAVLVYSLQRMTFLPYYVVLLIQVFLGVILYFFLNKVFKNETYLYCVSLGKEFLLKRRKRR